MHRLIIAAAIGFGLLSGGAAVNEAQARPAGHAIIGEARAATTQAEPVHARRHAHRHRYHRPPHRYVPRHHHARRHWAPPPHRHYRAWHPRPYRHYGWR